MNINLKVPFYPNTDDNTHCFQAVLKMIFKYFDPQNNYTFEMLDELTGKKKDLWTWPIKTMLSMEGLGYKVKTIEKFDYKTFAKNPYNYLKNLYGEEAANEQNKHSDLEAERANALNLTKTNIIDFRLPDLIDIQSLIEEGYLLLVLVNSAALNGKPGYVGHSVLVKGISDTHIIINDPGLPPYPERKILITDFLKAWAYPDENAKNILAIKK